MSSDTFLILRFRARSVAVPRDQSQTFEVSCLLTSTARTQ